jgi:polar amino acid transport system substrate-binding protein
MKTHTVLLFVIVLLVTILVAGCTSPGTPPQDQPGVTTAVTLPAVTLPPERTPTSPEAMVAFVENAYEYAKIHGKEAALAEFNNRSGRFVQGELYIFAYDLQANTLALPFQPDLIGKNRWNLTDAYGNRPTQENILAAQSGGNFVHYFYLDPSDNNTVKPKLTYAMLVDKDWIIGSGTYNAKEEDLFVRTGEDPRVRENLTSFVNDAVAYARQNGKAAALREFNNPNGSFVRGDRYVFALDYNGTTLAHPFSPDHVGTDRSGLQDSFGVNYTRVQSLIAQQGGGFVFYRYPNPMNSMTPEPKMSYVRPVDDTWYLGAGIYLGQPDADTSAALAGFTTGVNTTLQEIDRNLASAATDLGRTGITGPEANATLKQLLASSPLAPNAITVTPDGRVAAEAGSTEHGSIFGVSLADQAHVRQGLQEPQPLMSAVFTAVEGFDAVAIQRPVTDGTGAFSGLVSVVFDPSRVLAESANRSLAGTDFTAWAMDTDGHLIYDRDPGDLVGRSMISDPAYAGYPELVALSKRMIVEPAGSGTYTFTPTGGGPAVTKDAVWATASLHGTEWRLLVAREA